MQRITISVTDEIASALAREARRRGMSASAIARDALGTHLHLVIESGGRRKLGIVGIGASEGDAHARDLDRTLAQEWGDPGFDRGG